MYQLPVLANVHYGLTIQHYCLVTVLAIAILSYLQCMWSFVQCDIMSYRGDSDGWSLHNDRPLK